MSESGRLNSKLYQIRQCEIQNALNRAHQIYGDSCNSSACNPAPNYNQEVPRESDYLSKKVCPNPIIGVSCSLSSKLTQQRMQNVIDNSISSTDPLARFSQYDRPLAPPVCPPVPIEIINAFLPKASTKCPIPNKPTMS